VAKVILQDPLASFLVPPQATMVVTASLEPVVRDLVETKASADRVLRFLTESKLAAEDRDGTLLSLTYFYFAIKILLLTRDIICYLWSWINVLRPLKRPLLKRGVLARQPNRIFEPPRTLLLAWLMS
jgi:hypothetical protein